MGRGRATIHDVAGRLVLGAAALILAGCADLLGIGAPGRAADDAAAVDANGDSALDAAADAAADAAPDAALDAGVCVPETIRACYDGPPGTGGVGQCTIGTQPCVSSGDMWGACTGQGAPAVELCGGLADATDENCDGSPTCTGAFVALRIESGGAIVRLGRDAAGGRYELGDYYQAFDFSGTPLPAGEQGETFLARFHPDGSLAWVRGLAGPGWQVPLDLLVAADGTTTVVGLFTTPTGAPWMIGTRTLRTEYVGTPYMYIARFDVSGQPVWTSTLEQVGSDGMSNARAYLAPAPNDGVYVATDFGTANDGFFIGPTGTGSTQVAVYPEATIGLLQLGADGNLVSHVSMTPGGALGVPGDLSLGGLAVDGTGNVFIAGTSNVEVDPAGPAYCDAGGFFLKLGPPPTYAASYCYNFPGPPERIAIDALGYTYAVGQTASFGGRPYVTKRLAAGGAAWTMVATGTGTGSFFDLALDAAGQVATVGHCAGPIDLDPAGAGGAISGTGLCVAKYNASGTWLWSKSVSSSGSIAGNAVLAEPFGPLTVGGAFGGVADFGGGPITSSGELYRLSLRP